MKHAYLILAHKNWDQLKTLIELIDDERNDIYLHIDKKSKLTKESLDKILSSAEQSRIFLIKRTFITWGTFDMVEAEYRLLKAAINRGYDYYHLLSGQDLPLKTQDEIHSFFDQNQGKEFVGFGEAKWVNSVHYRYKYYWFFLNIVFNRNKGRVSSISKRFVLLQKICGVNRLKRYFLSAGAQWFSITDDFANYLCSKEETVKSRYRFTIIPDESFVQTIIADSCFVSSCYLYRNRLCMDSCMRMIDWNRGNPYIFRTKDFESLIKSGMIFARKFDSAVDDEVIGRIYRYLKGKND